MYIKQDMWRWKKNALKDAGLKEKDVIFGGRLGQYKYYDMAPVIEQVFNFYIF